MADSQKINYVNYTKKPVTAAQYSMMRGVTDFTNAEQLNMFEKGHGMIIVIDRPKFIEELANLTSINGDGGIRNLIDNFCNILEYEFKGLDGIEDINAEDLTYTDGISELAGVGKVTEQSNSEITMRFTEKSGSTITKFIKYYLSGVRDPRTQTKHYHGLIANGKMAMGFENEVFNLLYLVTDASGLQLEAAYLLANAWPNSAKTSIYNIEKGTIETAEIDVTFKCFVIQNEEVNKRAVKMLSWINRKSAVANAYSKTNGTNDASTTLANSVDNSNVRASNPIYWDSSEYKYKGLANVSSKINDTTLEKDITDAQGDGKTTGKYANGTEGQA